ncbi:MAG: hypothetical protein QOE63_729 [Acidimicrobiaceae bacterium]
MDLEWTDEQIELMATVRRLLGAHAPISPYVRAFVGGQAWTRDRAWAQLAAIGATGILVPVEHGGLGLGLVDATLVAEAAGAALYPGPWLASAVGAAAALRGATDTALLEAIAAGTTIGTIAIDGHFSVDGGRITGAARQVLDGTRADVVLVPVEGGLHAVRADATLATTTSLDRSREISELTMTGAPAERVGDWDAARARRTRRSLLVAMAADALGAADSVMRIAVAYAKERQQFGQPIGAFQAVQHLCVDMYETVELARGSVLHAAWALDVGAEGAGTAVDRLKAFADRMVTVADIAIQVLGGIGYTWEHDAHLYLKRLMTWETYLGSASSYRIAVGRAVAS